jgi:hypothetical protein
MVTRLPDLILIAGVVWVVLAIIMFIMAIVTSGGTDPSACGTCPDYWQQQMHLREAAP